jgi:hypothetical protein
MPDASPPDPAAILQRVDDLEKAYQWHRVPLVKQEMMWLCNQLRTALADTRRVEQETPQPPQLDAGEEAAVNEYIQAMQEEVIPEIVKALHERAKSAMISRRQPLFTDNA